MGLFDDLERELDRRHEALPPAPEFQADHSPVELPMNALTIVFEFGLFHLLFLDGPSRTCADVQREALRSALVLIEQERREGEAHHRANGTSSYGNPHPHLPSPLRSAGRAAHDRYDALEDAEHLIERHGLATLDERQLAALIRSQHSRPWPIGALDMESELKSVGRDYGWARLWLYRSHLVATGFGHSPSDLLRARKEVSDLVDDSEPLGGDTLTVLATRLADVSGLEPAEMGALAAVASPHWDEDCQRALVSNALDAPDVSARPGRPQIHQSVKNVVWRRDQAKCVECGSNERLEFDHIIPISKGGSNTPRNLQLLCEPCNRKKGSTI